MQSKANHFALDNFEGPLDFLLCLVQREEIDIYEVSLHQLIEQFIDKLSEWKDRQLELGTEFIAIMSWFIWMKSRLLIPQQEQTPTEEELEEDPRFEIIHHLIDYCRFKQLAKDLGSRQDKQSSYYYRGAPPPPTYVKPPGIDHVSIDELTDLFREMMKKASLPKKQIYEENWRVADKMDGIRLLLKENGSFPFYTLFSEGKSRIELIVIFLAVLELMKLGTIVVTKDQTSAALTISEKLEES